MRVRSKNRGELTSAKRKSAVHDGTNRSARALTGGVHRAAGAARTFKGKVAAAGELEPDDQLRSSVQSVVRSAPRNSWTRKGRVQRRAESAGMATASAVRDGGQLDVDQSVGQLVESVNRTSRNATVRYGAKGAKRAGEAGAKGAARVGTAGASSAARAGAAIDRNAVRAGAAGARGAVRVGKAGGRLTGQAARSGHRLTRRASHGASRLARTASVKAAGTAQRATVATQASVRIAVVAVRATAAAFVSAVSGSSLVPVIVAIIAVIAMLTAILPGFITGAGKQAQREESIAAVCSNSTYNLGAVKPHVQAAAEFLGSMFGITDIGGYRPGDTFDTEGHPAGLALDIMVPVNAAGREKGQALASYVQQHQGELGVKYQMWQRQIWSVQRADEGWRNVSDRGSVSANHEDHVHVSFESTPGSGALDELLAEACGAVTPEGGVGGTTSGGWASPVASMRISSPYGMRTHPVSGIYKLHTGDDYPGGGCGSPIYAVGGGTVMMSTPSWAGALVTIDHGGGVQSRYAHMYLNDVFVKTGDSVVVGQQLGKMGTNGWSTGCHLHLEVKVNGEFRGPAAFLAQKGIGGG